MWSDLLRYEDGKLYWLEKKGKDPHTKMWNTRYAGAEAGTLCRGYKVFSINKKTYLAHRIVWEMFNGKIPDEFQIDHINFDKSDNRIENLQLVTKAQNLRRNNQVSMGYSLYERNLERPYKASRTHKMFGTPCGAFMSYATAFIN